VADHVRQAIFLILTVRKGERPLEPSFGNSLMDYMFLPNTPNLRSRIEHHLSEAISTQEPRARDVEVKAFPVKDEPTRLRVAVSYRLGQDLRKTMVSVAYDLRGARWSMSDRERVARQMYDRLKAWPRRRCRGGVRSRPPTRADLLEAVAECAATSTRASAPKPSAFSTSSPLRAVSAHAAQPVRGVVCVRRDSRSSDPVTLPAGTAVFADLPAALADSRLRGGPALRDAPRPHRGDGAGSWPDRLPQDARSPFAFTGTPAPIRRFRRRRSGSRRGTGSLPRHRGGDRSGGGAFFVTGEVGQESAVEARRREKAFWFRVSPAATPPDGMRMEVLPNAAPFGSAASRRNGRSERRSASPTSRSRCRSRLRGPTSRFSSRGPDPVEGGDDLAGAGPDEKCFRFDPALRLLMFGDGRHGAIPAPRGAKIYLRNLRDIGDGTRLRRTRSPGSSATSRRWRGSSSRTRFSRPSRPKTSPDTANVSGRRS